MIQTICSLCLLEEAFLERSLLFHGRVCVIVVLLHEAGLASYLANNALSIVVEDTDPLDGLERALLVSEHELCGTARCQM